jgi:hypothetical protein
MRLKEGEHFSTNSNHWRGITNHIVVVQKGMFVAQFMAVGYMRMNVLSPRFVLIPGCIPSNLR